MSILDDITFEIYEGSETPPEGFPEGTLSWDWTVAYDGYSFEGHYFTGPGITRDPSKEDILWCIASDHALWTEDPTLEDIGGASDETLRTLAERADDMANVFGLDLDEFIEAALELDL